MHCHIAVSTLCAVLLTTLSIPIASSFALSSSTLHPWASVQNNVSFTGVAVYHDLLLSVGSTTQPGLLQLTRHTQDGQLISSHLLDIFASVTIPSTSFRSGAYFASSTLHVDAALGAAFVLLRQPLFENPNHPRSIQTNFRVLVRVDLSTNTVSWAKVLPSAIASYLFDSLSISLDTVSQSVFIYTVPNCTNADNCDLHVSSFSFAGDLKWSRSMDVTSKEYPLGLSADSVGLVTLTEARSGGFLLSSYGLDGTKHWSQVVMSDASFLSHITVNTDLDNYRYIYGMGYKSEYPSWGATRMQFITKWSAESGQLLWTRFLPKMYKSTTALLTAMTIVNASIYTSGQMYQGMDDFVDQPYSTVLSRWSLHGERKWTLQQAQSYRQVPSQLVVADEYSIFIAGAHLSNHLPILDFKMRSGHIVAPGFLRHVTVGCHNQTHHVNSAGICTPCPSSYIKDGRCVACEPGTYLPEGAGQVCQPCPTGSYCNAVDMKPLPCPAGTVCLFRAERPQLCRSGYYCPSPTTATPCPPGKYCPPGVATALPCPVGTFCPLKSMEAPVACPSSCTCNDLSIRFCESPDHAKYLYAIVGLTGLIVLLLLAIGYLKFDHKSKGEVDSPPMMELEGIPNAIV